MVKGFGYLQGFSPYLLLLLIYCSSQSLYTFISYLLKGFFPVMFIPISEMIRSKTALPNNLLHLKLYFINR